jgi:hypothetical protein
MKEFLDWFFTTDAKAGEFNPTMGPCVFGLSVCFWLTVAGLALRFVRSESKWIRVAGWLAILSLPIYLTFVFSALLLSQYMR